MSDGEKIAIGTVVIKVAHDVQMITDHRYFFHFFGLDSELPSASHVMWVSSAAWVVGRRKPPSISWIQIHALNLVVRAWDFLVQTLANFSRCDLKVSNPI